MNISMNLESYFDNTRNIENVNFWWCPEFIHHEGHEVSRRTKQLSFVGLRGLWIHEFGTPHSAGTGLLINHDHIRANVLSRAGEQNCIEVRRIGAIIHIEIIRIALKGNAGVGVRDAATRADRAV